MPKGIYKHKPLTQKTKDNMSKARMGHKTTQETKDKIRKALTGHKHTQEHKDNISKSMIGKNSGENNYLWKGGEYQQTNRRWIIYADGIGYLRYRYVAMKCLGRELLKGEIIHHINGDCSDDRPENLYLFPTNGKHMSQHRMKNPPILLSNLI